MNPELQPLMESVKKLPFTDQLYLICEISRSLSIYHKPIVSDIVSDYSRSYDEWLEELITLYPVETPEKILNKRIEEERNNWD
jgi:hypothetical protein